MVREIVRYDILSKVEQLLAPSIERIADIDERIQRQEEMLRELPDLKMVVSTLAASQATIAQAVTSISETFKKVEERQEKLETVNQEINERAMGKDQIPMKSHYLSLLGAIIPVFLMAGTVVLYTLFHTKQTLSATLHDIEIGQKATQNKVEEVKKQIEEVSPEK